MEHYIKLVVLKNSCINKTEKRKISKDLFEQLILLFVKSGIDFEITSRKNKTISIYWDDESIKDLKAITSDFTKLYKRYNII